jgi:hypothetical protein
MHWHVSFRRGGVLAGTSRLYGRWSDARTTQQKKSMEGETDSKEPVMKVWIYVDTSKQVCDEDYLKVFADKDHANAWFNDHHPEGVAFEYPVIGEPRMIRRPIP